VFGLEDYIIVSQPFHCGRALYLAKQDGQQAVGFCARDVKSAAGIKMRLREILARNKAVLDVLLNKKPKYLGKKETVTYRTSVTVGCDESHHFLLYKTAENQKFESSSLSVARYSCWPSFT
jgi:vancomycin permeability regulator SanA